MQAERSRRLPFGQVRVSPWLPKMANWVAFMALVRPINALHRQCTAWRVAAQGPRAPLQRMAGAAGTAVLDWYYQWRFAPIARAAAAPMLPPEAFDPGHILLVIGTLGPGGSERQLVETALGLKRSGKERITVLCQSLEHAWQRFFVPALAEAGVEVAALTGAQAPTDQADAEAKRRFRAAFRRVPTIGRDVRRYAVEMVRRRPGVAHLWLDETNCKAGLAAVCVGVPRVILSARSVPPYHFGLYQPYMRPAYRALLPAAGVGLVNNSCAGARDYARWLGAGADEIEVIHNGFDFEGLPSPQLRAERREALRSALGVPADAMLVGGVLRFTEEKRPGLWLDAALALAARNASFHFLLIGDGPLWRRLKRRIARVDAAARIHLPGHQRDVVSALAAMDVLLMTSRMEGLPNVLIEAQALGIPVVSTDAGGARETFLPGESGRLVAGNAAAIAEAISELANDPQRRAAWGRAGMRQARERFSGAAMIDRTRVMYRGGIVE